MRATPLAWLVYISRHDGMTHYRVAEHIEPAIALDRDTCWSSGDAPSCFDGDGYIQPDQRCQVPADKIAKAQVIASTPLLRDALEDLLAHEDGESPEIRALAVRNARSVLKQLEESLAGIEESQ